MSELIAIIGVNSKQNTKPVNINKRAIYILGVTGGTAVALTLFSIPFLSPGLRKICVPYVPASEQQIFNVLTALKGRSGSLVDLGSGDGRIVRAAASLGFKVDGVELNLWLVLYSRVISLFKGVSKGTHFYRRNLWSFNLKPYSNIVVFGTKEMMPEVEKKCFKELDKNSCVVTCRFPLPNTNPDLIIGKGIDTVWRYNLKNTS